MDNKFIAYCGLNCETCKARIATINNDDKLREETAKEWAEMNNSPEITPETINCTGCRIDGVKFYYCGHLCEIRKCAISKGFSTCADCSEMYKCEKVAQIHSGVPECLENLKNNK